MGYMKNMKNLDEYESIGIHWIALSVNAESDIL